MSKFTCKDCGSDYESAKTFVAHVPTCENNYNENASLQLQNAAIFLRDWVELGSGTGFVAAPNTKKKIAKLAVNTKAWLIVNKLQGNLK
jgi:hypothetical protein